MKILLHYCSLGTRVELLCVPYEAKKKYVSQKNYCISRCEKSTQYLKGCDISLVLHMVTVARKSEVVAMSNFPPCVAKHVWGDYGKCSRNELAKLGSEWGRWP
jgi:hypothetical protein